MTNVGDSSFHTYLYVCFSVSFSLWVRVCACVGGCGREALAPYWKDVLVLLLRRVQEARTPKLTRAFSSLLCLFVARVPSGALALQALFESVQPGYTGPLHREKSGWVRACVRACVCMCHCHSDVSV
jgi:hypothetical protein